MDPSGPRLRANRRKQEVLLALLREAREKRGLRQVDVAAALHCPQTRVSKDELGTRRLDLLELRDVCRVLGVHLVDFVRSFDDKIRVMERSRVKAEDSPSLQRQKQGRPVVPSIRDRETALAADFFGPRERVRAWSAPAAKSHGGRASHAAGRRPARAAPATVGDRGGTTRRWRPRKPSLAAAPGGETIAGQAVVRVGSEHVAAAGLHAPPRRQRAAGRGTTPTLAAMLAEGLTAPRRFRSRLGPSLSGLRLVLSSHRTFARPGGSGAPEGANPATTHDWDMRA